MLRSGVLIPGRSNPTCGAVKRALILMSAFIWPPASSLGCAPLAPTCGFPNAGAKYARRAPCQHDFGTGLAPYLAGRGRGQAPL